MKLSNHPTVIAYHEKKDSILEPLDKFEAANLKQLALDAGADTAGLIDLSRDSISEYRKGLLDVMPETKSIMILALRINQAPLRSMAHSIANQEFKQVWTKFKHIQAELVNHLRKSGIKAVNIPIGFPMEVDKWPKKMWLASDKEFAVEAGIGQMGYNRLVLHPKFGAAIFLGTTLLSCECDQYDQPIEYNPCIECGLCLKVCPTGAIKNTDNFDFTACYTHNYRERLGGFLSWVEQVVDSKNSSDYRRRVSDSETYSMWQNLSIGAQTRCDRCMAICPAGEDCIGEYLEDRKTLNQYRKRFKNLPETIYAVKGSDAEQHVLANFPEKKLKLVSNGLHPLSVEMFLESLPRVFQTNQSQGIDTVYHFSFTGNEILESTVIIKEKTISVQDGLKGEPDLHVIADSQTWVKFLAKEANLLMALVTRKIKIKGSPKLMKAFAACFPS